MTIQIFKTISVLALLQIIVSCKSEQLVAPGTPMFPIVKEEHQYTLAKQSLTLIEASLVTIPQGVFYMGCVNHDMLCEETEKPRHSQEVNPFKIMRHEVSWEIYQPCIKAGICPNYRNFSSDDDQLPAVNVSWDDIVKIFIPWINKYSTRKYRLPTEVEWEYAARANSQTIYSWGDLPSGEFANGSEKSGWPSDGFLRNEAPVMSFKPNSFGLYDMSGNVWEWVQDCWDENKYKTTDSKDDHKTSHIECKQRVLRGGSWGYQPNYLRNSMRYYSYANSRFHIYGFRLVRD